MMNETGSGMGRHLIGGSIGAALVIALAVWACSRPAMGAHRVAEPGNAGPSTGRSPSSLGSADPTEGRVEPSRTVADSSGSAAPDAPAESSVPSSAAPGAPLDSATVFFLGHSLQGWRAPAMIGDFADSTGAQYSFKAAIGIGANLGWQWTHPERAEGHDPRVTLAREPFDVLVMTEAIPLADQLRWADTVDYAMNFLELARAQNPRVQTYIYETWDYLTVDNWRQRLDADRALWRSIVDDMNARGGGAPVRLIPGGRAMAALHDAIVDGSVPGISNVRALFLDDVHLTDAGWYFIACVQFATIFRRSPVGLPATTTDRFGRPISAPPGGSAAVMQRIAWDVVRTDPLSGVSP